MQSKNSKLVVTVPQPTGKHASPTQHKKQQGNWSREADEKAAEARQEALNETCKAVLRARGGPGASDNRYAQQESSTKIVPVTKGRLCNAALDQSGLHALTCEYGIARKRRHDIIVKWVAKTHTACTGESTTMEQIVPE